jgi:hypothetical protein
MKRRETIIVVLMVVAIVYAAYSFIFDQPVERGPESNSTTGNPITISVENSSGSGNKNKELRKFVATVFKKINKKKSVVDTHIIKMAIAEWKRDPFLRTDLDTESGLNGGAGFYKSKKEIIYSGYLKLGNKMLAVINGIEYEEGEMLETGVYFVSDITSSVVVLKNSSNKTITLSLQETIRDE